MEVVVTECPRKVFFSVLFITQLGKNNKTCGDRRVEVKEEIADSSVQNRETVLFPTTLVFFATTARVGIAYLDRSLSLTWQPEYHSELRGKVSATDPP